MQGDLSRAGKPLLFRGTNFATGPCGAARRSYTEIGRGAIEMKNETGFSRKEISYITGREASARCLFRGRSRPFTSETATLPRGYKMFRPLVGVCHVGEKPWIKSVVSRGNGRGGEVSLP